MLLSVTLVLGAVYLCLQHWQTPLIPKQPALSLSGEAAREYLEQGGEGQSLMAAVTAAQFSLQRQDHSPSDEQSGAGYLAVSHDQNLHAWFGSDGVAVHPTVAEEQRAAAWQMEMQLKAYGYGEELAAAPPITARIVQGTRIEYERRSGFEAPAGAQSMAGNPH